MRRYRSNNSQPPRWIEARFNSKCDETGAVIRKGDKCLYYPASRKVYSADSRTAQDWEAGAFDRMIEDQVCERYGF